MSYVSVSGSDWAGVYAREMGLYCQWITHSTFQNNEIGFYLSDVY